MKWELIIRQPAVTDSKIKGTYAGLWLSEESAVRLHEWLRENCEIEHIVAPEDFHCTVTYSRRILPELVKDIPEVMPFTAKPSSWKVFTDDGYPCLVLALNAPEIVGLHKWILRDHGATWCYKDYTPHVTVAVRGEWSPPTLVPSAMELTFDQWRVGALEE